MEKKEKSMWFLATTHLFTAYFAVPIIFGGILMAFFYFLAPGMFDSDVYKVLATLVGFVAIPFGVYYSRSYITKNYIVKDAKTLITRATIYAALIGLLLFGSDIYLIPQTDPVAFAVQGEYWSFLTEAIFGVVEIAIFYYFSKRAFGVK